MRPKGKTSIKIVTSCEKKNHKSHTFDINSIYKMSVVEMKKLWWMCGKNRKDKIRKCNIREMVNVEPIENELRDNRLRWFDIYVVGQLMW